jgi:hypothetical protein
MRLRAALVVAALVGCALPVTGEAAQAYLTVTSNGSRRVRFTLPSGVTIAWSKATLTGGGTYRAAVLDRALRDRSAGTVTNVLGTSALAAAPVREGRSDTAAYPAGTYDVYLATDSAATLKVPVSGMRSRTYAATSSLRPTATTADVRPDVLLPPYDAAGSTKATVGSTFGLAFARWDVTALPGTYDTRVEVCLRPPSNCTAHTAGGLHPELPASRALEAAEWVKPGQYGGTGATTATTRYQGSWRPERGRLLALTIPVAPPPPPPPSRPDTTTASPMVVAVLSVEGNERLVAGRLGQPMKTVRKTGWGGSAQCLAVSPDGRHVAYTEQGSSVAVAATDGSSHRVVTSNRADPCDIVWSRDGARLYYSDRVGSRYYVYTVRADGAGAPARVPNSADLRPKSIRGTSIAGSDMTRGGRFLGSAVMSTGGNGRRTVGPTNHAGPVWSPDGRWLATFTVLRTAHEGSTIQVRLLDARTGAVRALSATQPSSTLGLAYPLAWTRDARTLYYVHYDERHGQSVNPRIFTIRADGTGKRDVTPRFGTGRLMTVAVQQR